jgi:hypothetical protein
MLKSFAFALRPEVKRAAEELALMIAKERGSDVAADAIVNALAA